MNFLTATPAAGGMGSTVIMMVLMIAIFYFMLIRPENKRKKEAEEMRSAVKKGDKVVTIGGITGVVVDVKENKFVLPIRFVSNLRSGHCPPTRLPLRLRRLRLRRLRKPRLRQRLPRRLKRTSNLPRTGFDFSKPVFL